MQNINSTRATSSGSQCSQIRKSVRSCACMSMYLHDYKLVKQMTKNIRKREVTEIADSTKQRKCSVIFTQDDDVK